MAGDWIKVHRKLLEHPIMQHDGLCRLWMYCLMRANWKPGKWFVPGTMKQIDLSRGQFIAGRETLCDSLYGSDYKGEYKPSSRTLWRWLQSLESLGCLKLENVSNRCTLVTVCKYDTYQSLKDTECPTDVPPVSNGCPTDVQPMSTDKESKKVRREESKKTQNGFVPPSVEEVAAYCTERNNGIDAQQWIDFWEARGWKFKGGGKMANWKAALRNYERSEFNPSRKPAMFTAADSYDPSGDGK